MPLRCNKAIERLSSRRGSLGGDGNTVAHCEFDALAITISNASRSGSFPSASKTGPAERQARSS